MSAAIALAPIPVRPDPVRPVIHRTRGRSHGPITRLMSPGDLGEILEVIEQPHQVLCRIDLEGKEALIPVHEQTLRKVDQQKREVHVELPDGLLDVYR